MEGKMKAQLFYGPQDVRLEFIDIPKIGPGEALRILGHSDISTTTIYITLANIDVENEI